MSAGPYDIDVDAKTGGKVGVYTTCTVPPNEFLGSSTTERLWFCSRINRARDSRAVRALSPRRHAFRRYSVLSAPRLNRGRSR